MKKSIISFIVTLLFLSACGEYNNEKSYHIEGGVISKQVLDNYLSRAITQAELFNEGFYVDGEYPNIEDDERMLLNIGAKFIGRAIYRWGRESAFNHPEWLGNAKKRIEKMHKQDPDIIFQACVFEIVTEEVEQIAIPDWVFAAFDKTPENRNFVLDDMKFPDNRQTQTQRRRRSGVPDVSREETQMFFYYISVRYMEIGAEAIHFGQAYMIGRADKEQNYAGWRKVISKVKEAAKTKARRGTVLCDSHTQNIAVDGHLIFDFCSFPLRVKEVQDDPMKGELAVNFLSDLYGDAQGSMFGKTVGGITPSGWACERSPYILEFDNFGIGEKPGDPTFDWFTWGYDEISWFYLQDTDYKNSFLHYAVDFIKQTDPVGFIQMPGSRVAVLTDKRTRYRCNTKSAACPEGHSQEETIKAIWASDK